MKFPDLTQFPVIAYDTETTGLHWWEDKIFGVSIAVPDGPAWYWDVRKNSYVLPWLREVIPHVKKLVAHRAQFDWHMSREAGILFPEGRVECTMIRAALIDEHRLTYDLDSLAQHYCGIGKDNTIYQKLADLFGGKATRPAQGPNFPRAPESMMSDYARQDAKACLALWQTQEAEIEKQELRQVHNVEMRLLAAIVRMEKHGVRVDIPAAEKAIKTLTAHIDDKQKQLDKAAGFNVNVNSGPQMHKMFTPVEGRAADGTKIWTLCDGTDAELTDGGKASIDADCLRRMKDGRAMMVLDLRKTLKARDTFLKGHILGHHHGGYVHANYNQTKGDSGGTGTGRLSVNDPAMQQIPKRDKLMAAVVRAVFLPDVGHDWTCNDWAQMDFRVFSHYTNIAKIIEMYLADPDTDFHGLAASLTGLPRSPRFAGDPNAKQINLGLVFGMGKGRMAQEMGLPYTVEPNGRGGTFLKAGPEAEAVFHQYHSNIPGVNDFLRDASTVAKSRGYVRTCIGRRIRFPRGQFTHKAGGLIFQGSAAEALKQKIIELDDYFLSEDGEAGHLIVNVHDEFDCTVPQGRTDVHAEISRIVTAFGPDDAIHFRVPIRTDQGVGPNWHEASK